MIGRRVRAWSGWLAVALGVLAAWAGALYVTARAAAETESVAAALAVADPDPLATARVVARFGDLAVLALLEPKRPVAEQLYGLFAMPWVEAHWLALPRLAALLRSRDSVLAPAAADCLLRIVERIGAQRMDRSEVDRSELCVVVPQLRVVAADEVLGADIRLAAGVGAHVLEGLCPASAGAEES